MNPPSNNKRLIVIVGGGFGGMRVARLLSRQRRRLKRPILLIDKHRHHVYTPLLYEVASGCTTGVETETQLIHGAAFSFKDALRSCCEVTFMRGEAAALNPAARSLQLKDGTSLAYHTLVLALGSETEFFGIPGLREHALTLKTRQDALDIRRRVEMLLTKSQGSRKNGMLRLIVGGGGATGTEFAAEMSGCFHAMERRGALRRGSWEITLVEATGRLLGMLKPELSSFAKHRLEKHGVKVMLDTCFKTIENGTVMIAPRPLKPGEDPGALVCDLAPGSEQRLSADLVVWTGGVRGPSVFKTFNLPLDGKNRLLVDPSLRVQGQKNIYALGDCASLVHPKTKAPVPCLAQAALREADVAVANILADLGLKAARRKYDFPAYPAVVPLGGKHALAAIGPFTFKGFSGWLIRRAADLRYFVTSLPLPYALRAFFRGAWLYMRND